LRIFHSGSSSVVGFADGLAGHFQHACIRPPPAHHACKVGWRHLAAGLFAAGVEDERLAMRGQISQLLQ
jgi:hypothetical protein